MPDLTPGALTAYLDGELPKSAGDRIREDTDASKRLEQRREQRRFVTDRLSELAGSSPDLDAAWRAVQHRVRAPDIPEVRGPDFAAHRFGLRLSRPPLGRAAAIVLLAAGAASAALPGSPVREWLAGTPEAREASTPAPAGADTESAPALAAPPPADEISLRAPAGETVDVALVAPGRDAVLHVRLVDGDRLRLQARPSGGFSTGPGRLEARGAEGPVELAVPRTASVRVVVDGREALSVRSGRIVGPDGLRLDTPARIRLTPGGDAPAPNTSPGSP